MSKAKEIAGLERGTDAIRGMRLVLSARLEEVCALGRIALGWADTTDVHNFRIALHRLRSAMRDFKPYLQTKRLNLARQQLKNIAGALGAVRNQDAVVAVMEKVQQESPFELSAGIQKFIDTSLGNRDRLFGELIKIAGDEALVALEKSYLEQLNEAVEPAQSNGGGFPGLTFGQVAQRVALVRSRELQELGSSLYQPFKTEEIYRTRIAAKRLRYALDLIGLCAGEGRIKTFTEEVARLQADLGKLHDSDLAIHYLSGRLTAGEKSGEGAKGDDEQRNVAVWLLGQLVKSRAKHFQEAVMLWYEWERDGFARQLIAALDVTTGAEYLTR